MHFHIRHSILLVFFSALFFNACTSDPPTGPQLDLTPYELDIPEGFPMPAFPEGNELTEARVELGKKLFFDKALSRDFSLSCESCHKQALAFSDPVLVEPGLQLNLGLRNSPTLANVAYHPYFFREGGSPNLELQAAAPIESEEEMNFSIPELVQRLSEDSDYVEMALKAYGREMDAFVITRALASFQRTLISGNAKYDQVVRGETSFTAEEELGFTIFNDANCNVCHSGFDLTNYTFENNGLYTVYEDGGLYRRTLDTLDVGKFKIPSLRNIELTAPYMHNGSLATLEDVVEHYNSGGQNHPNKNGLIQNLDLDQSQKNALIAFLKTLTDQEFITNPAFSPE